eukprot:Sspe_Gene.114547::Locus_100241_Transcript_1_1_Confidence_1.000_Length_426::g.114547::m.114547
MPGDDRDAIFFRNTLRSYLRTPKRAHRDPRRRGERWRKKVAKEGGEEVENVAKRLEQFEAEFRRSRRMAAQQAAAYHAHAEAIKNNKGEQVPPQRGWETGSIGSSFANTRCASRCASR